MIRSIVKTSLAFSFLFVAFHVSAQDKFEIIHHYKPFKVDAGLGYARPQGFGAKAGALMYIEPKFNLLDKVSVGLRGEATAMARGAFNAGDFEASGEAGLSFSALGTADYYFTNRLVRPYVGGGAGVYKLISVEGTSNGGGSITIPTETKFGGMVRAGVEIWHIRLGAEYNFIGKSGIIANNYFGLKFGIVFGGGLKDDYKNEEY
ncbi:MAG: hypothetical protein QM725_08390 [Lacibacter sp.]